MGCTGIVLIDGLGRRCWCADVGWYIFGIDFSYADQVVEEIARGVALGVLFVGRVTNGDVVVAVDAQFAEETLPMLGS